MQAKPEPPPVKRGVTIPVPQKPARAQRQFRAAKITKALGRAARALFAP